MAAKLYNQKNKQGRAATGRNLANCSTMKTIIREAAKLLYKYDGITPTKQEKQEASREYAKYILDSVQYFIQNANRG